jgi:hypothetical protein
MFINKKLMWLLKRSFISPRKREIFDNQFQIHGATVVVVKVLLTQVSKAVLMACKLFLVI